MKRGESMNNNEHKSIALVMLGMVAVIAIIGLVLMFVQGAAPTGRAVQTENNVAEYGFGFEDRRLSGQRELRVIDSAYSCGSGMVPVDDNRATELKSLGVPVYEYSYPNNPSETFKCVSWEESKGSDQAGYYSDHGIQVPLQ